jgi:hypothetical protein
LVQKDPSGFNPIQLVLLVETGLLICSSITCIGPGVGLVTAKLYVE